MPLRPAERLSRSRARHVKRSWFNDLTKYSDQVVRKGRLGPADSHANAPKDAKGCPRDDHAAIRTEEKCRDAAALGLPVKVSDDERDPSPAAFPVWPEDPVRLGDALPRQNAVEDDGLDIAHGFLEKRVVRQAPAHDSFDLIGEIGIVLRSRPDGEDEMIGIHRR